MANSGKGEDRVGSNFSSSLLSSTAEAAAQVSSSASKSAAAAVSSSISSPNIAASSSSSSSSAFFFQSISHELDGQLRACPPTTSTIASANSTESLSLMPKWEGWRWRWSCRPTTTSTALSSSGTTASTVIRSSRPSSEALSCGEDNQRALYDDFQHPPSHHNYHHHHHHQQQQQQQQRQRQKPQQQQRYRERLNSLTIHLTVALIFTATFACFPSLVGSAASTSGQDENDSLVCMKGISNGFPGATYPRGDIFIKEGDMLEVFCKLNLTNPAAEGFNASHIEFVFGKSDIPLDQVEKSVINETTAVVRVKHMNASNPFLRCLLKKPDESFIPVCYNQIDVGYPPLPVEDFRCVAREWKSLNCSWKLPWNPVPTKYKLISLWKWNKQVLCPNSTTTPTSCTWDGRTEPHYRSGVDPVHVLLNGTNPLLPSGNAWEYKFSLTSIVIPEKPIIQMVQQSPYHYMLNWTFENYEYYTPGLNHRLSICFLSEGKEKCNTTLYQTIPKEKKMTPYLIKNITLPYAYTNYTIAVRLRSPGTNDTEEWWSEPDNRTIVTEMKAPDFPPETDIASFETSPAGQDLRTVYLYWKSISEHFKNGPGFNYTIEVYENKSKRLNITPDVLTEAYAQYNGLKAASSYHFYIAAYNSIGKSKNASEIAVLSVDKLPGEPQFVSKIDFTNGSFDISWKRPGRYNDILSYTVFRCASNKPHPYPCEGPLEWDRIEATKNETMQKYYNSLALESNHQFAVSANTNKFGSGMVWAACTLIHGRVPGKLRSVRAEDTKEDEILIKWNLECAYRSGDIEGFKITYCEVERYPAEKCKDGESLSGAVEGADITAYRLVNLKPHSMYMIFVEILTAAGLSPKSDVVYARTSEGAPSSVTVFNVSQVTNVSAVLSIQSPENWNGMLREYKIYYKVNAKNKNVNQKLFQLSNETHQDQPVQVTLDNLRSNSNYTVYIVACTTKCSNRSQPLTFRTDVGYTNLSSFPRISYNDGAMEVEWDKPDRLGGPIQSFQLMLKRNGEPVDMDEYNTVDFHSDRDKFSARLPQECEPSTNFTVQIRAVTRLTDEKYLYGAWSPPGNYSCGGSTSWLVWLILLVVALVALTVFVYLSVRGYNYFRKMKDGLAIKLPPGLNSELNGFAHKTPPRSRSNDNSKEMYAYPLQPTSTQLDESKDFLSSSDLNQGEAEESLIEKPYCPSPTNPLLGGLDFSIIRTNGGDSIPMEDEDNDIRLTDFSSIQQDHCLSPTTYKKLGIQSNGSAVLIEPMPGPSSRSTPSLNSESGGDFSTSSPSHNTISHASNHLPHPSSSSSMLPKISQNHHPSPLRGESSTACNGINRTVPDVLSSSPSSPISSLTTSSLLPSSSTQQAPTSSSRNHVAPSIPPLAAVSPPVAPPPQAAAPPSSSYVKWTTLVPDMKTGDAGGVLENGTRSPYCQVGILLE